MLLIDATTVTVLTRAALRSYALQFAYSLHLPPYSFSLPTPSSGPSSCKLYGVAAAGSRATLTSSAYTHTELAYQFANAHLVFSRLSLVPVVHAALKSLGYSESEIRARVVMVTSQWLTGGDTTNLVRLDAFFWMWGA